MTTTDHFGGYTPPPGAPQSPPPPFPPQHRLIRRSRTDRIGAGVAGGLGEYFGVDPVLFRVLFATAAFFGGAGLLAYLLMWLAIPEQGTPEAPIDHFAAWLRRRHVPVWAVVLVAGIGLWLAAFSWWVPGHWGWWGPGPIIPIVIVVIILVAIFGRRGGVSPRTAPPATGNPPSGGAMGAAMTGSMPPGSMPPGSMPPGSMPPGSTAPGEAGFGATAAVDAPATTSDDAAGSATAPMPGQEPPAWISNTHGWLSEARQARRERRRRALPVRTSALVALVVTLGVLGVIDAVVGIALPVYFWVTLGIVVAALAVGLAMRRTPWSLAILLVPSVLGLVAFSGTSAQLHDGFGQRVWTPTSESALSSNYRLAFGQAILDLRNVGILGTPTTVHVTLAAGQVRVILPPTADATINASVRFGDVTVDGQDVTGPGGWHSRGANINRTILPPAGATGAPITIDVHLADGNIAIQHSP